MSKRRTVASPTVLDLEHVLTSIVQSIEAPSAVHAFLSALPASARSPPLAALHELLEHPLRMTRIPFDCEQRARSRMWPRLYLDELTPAATALVRDAMPVIAAAAGSNSSDGVPPDVDALAWLELWSVKLMQYTHKYHRDPRDLPRRCAILRKCIRLTDVDLPHDTSVLEAVTTPAHRVASITASCIETDASFLMALGRWLQSTHATSLTLEYQHMDRRAAVSAGLAPMLAKTTSLERLILRSSVPGVVAPLVAVAPAFQRLTRLDITVHEADKAALWSFLERLNRTKLSSLRVVCNEMELSLLVPSLRRSQP
ncbi:hypothetical protein SPRG_12889 [Saprolegnia parasitica CBS 223.65]|uniref:F-box domain-containing protein n=1 Tax=Saprolegnia parasitica (strain CBS 223.65) TaxID=695850 RepID=A0A067BTR1_SAPPC|nr:hypothetical protein SPRG_12889 [Saprolegnia parasitica CBS 223.65]KDO21648.1 hypothetical protein SPRG_12889 [Saprolegnia parasitica CBS 223.65]|eukprot:XP_012207660.1 hypothetical protein SPRG_12889 [Saprolegnia parasitica CBS 223.65]